MIKSGLASTAKTVVERMSVKIGYDYINSQKSIIKMNTEFYRNPGNLRIEAVRSVHNRAILPSFFLLDRYKIIKA